MNSTSPVSGTSGLQPQSFETHETLPKAKQPSKLIEVNSRVYIHYDRDELHVPRPEQDHWINYQGHDAARLAIVAMKSFQNKGWQAGFITSGGKYFNFPHETYKQQTYPFRRWGIWFQLLSYAPCWLSTIDVINWNFPANQALNANYDRWTVSIQKDSLFKREIPDGLALTPFAHPTCACLFVTPDFVLSAIDRIQKFLNDKETVNCMILSDEAILREKMPERFQCMKLPGTVIDHYSRSTISRYF